MFHVPLIESYLSNQPFRIIFVENWEPLLVPINMGIEGIKTLMYQSLMDLLKSIIEEEKHECYWNNKKS